MLEIGVKYYRNIFKNCLKHGAQNINRDLKTKLIKCLNCNSNLHTDLK